MEVESQCEQVRRFLLDRLAVAAGGRSRGWLERLTGWLLYVPEATYVFEYAGCDPDRGHCAGAVRAAWVIDREGVRPTDVSPGTVPDDRRGMWYRFDRVCFYIAPAGDWVIQTTMRGPRAGGGGRYRVAPDGDGFALIAEEPHWKT